MKFTTELAKSIQEKHGVSNITIRIWKLRGQIPDHYFQSSQPEKTEVLPDCSDITAEKAIHHGKKIWLALMKGAGAREYRAYWESIKENPYWRGEFMAEVDSWGAYHAKTGDLKKPAESIRKFMKQVKPMQQLTEKESLPYPGGTRIDDNMAIMLVVYELEGWPGVKKAFPEQVKGKERAIQKALSKYNPKQNHWTKKPVGESYAQKAKAFADTNGGKIRVAKSGTIYVELPNGTKHRFADHSTDVDFDLSSNNF